MTMLSMTKVALITGCSEPTGIGASLALELRARGVKVYATARNINTLTKLKEAGCETLALDVTNAEDIIFAVDAVKTNDGYLDILVNNAGVVSNAPLLDSDISKMQQVFAVNTFAPVLVTQAFMPLLVAAVQKGGGKAVVLNVGSLTAAGMPWLGTYGASKAAVQCLSDAMRGEIRNLGVNVITLHLGAVSTPMSSGEKDINTLVDGETSGYYPNWAMIYQKINKGYNEVVAKAPQPSAAAKTIGNALLAKTPPTRLYAGYMSGFVRYVIPFLPVSVVDNMFYKAQFVAEVVAPGGTGGDTKTVEDKKND